MSETEAQTTVAAYRKKFGILDSHELTGLRLSQREEFHLEISNASKKSLVIAGFTKHYAKRICEQDVYLSEDLIRSTGMLDV